MGAAADDDELHEATMDELLDAAIAAERASGVHEETVEAARRHLAVRVALVVGGALVALVGLALLVLPGPGLIVVAIGLGIMATEVPFAARLLTRVRRRLPQDDDGRIPTQVWVTMISMGVVATAASIAFTRYR